MKSGSRRPELSAPRPPGAARVHRARVLLFLAFLAGPGPLRGQEPAILSADAFALGAGRVEVSYGAEYVVKDGRLDAVFEGGSHTLPALRYLTRVLPFSVRIGVSANVDVIVGWRGGLIARPDIGPSHSDWGDPSLTTKITLTDTGGPAAAGILFGVKLPSTRYLPAGLGSDAMDAYLLATVSRRFAPGGELRANAGVGIVGDPRFAGSQDDIFTGSAMALWRPAERLALFAEVYGFTGPREDDDKLQLRGGGSFESPIGTVTLYGLTRLAGNPYDFGTAFAGSPEWGIGGSLTHRFAW